MKSLKNKKLIFIFIAIFILLRLILLIKIDHSYMGGDARSYDNLASSQKLLDYNKIFQKDSILIKQLKNYEYESQDNFPYLELTYDYFWDPGYPFLLSVIYKIYSENRIIVQVVQYLLIGIILLFWYKMLLKYKVNKLHFYILLIIMVHPFFLAHPLLLYSEPLDLLFITLIYYLLTQTKSSKTLFGLGLVSGLLVITESFYLPLVISLLIWISFKYKSSRNILIVFTPFILIVSPIIIHNYIATGGGIFISSKNTYNLWIDNNNFPPPNYDMNEIKNPLPKQYYSKPKKFSYIRPPCKVSFYNQGRCEINNVLSFISEDPLRFIKRSLIKWKNLWSPNLFPFNIGFNKYALNMSHSIAKVLHNIYVFFEMIFITTFFLSFGYLFFLKERISVPIILHILFYHFVVSFGHGMSRYRFGITPIMVATISIALSKLNPQIYRKKSFIVTSIFIILILCYIFIDKYPIVIV